MPDGDVVVAGKTRSHGGGRAAGWSARLDPGGETRWTRTIGGARATDGFKRGLPRADGGTRLIGQTRSEGAGESDGWLLDLNAEGNTERERVFGGPENDRFVDAAMLADGGTLAVGFTASYGAGDRDVWAVRTDAEGRAVWQRTFGGSRDDGAYGVAVHDGRAVVVGYTRTDGEAGYDVWAARLDLADGEAVWTRTLDRSGMDAATSVTFAGDGDVVIAASTAGGGFGRDDIWLIRLSADGDNVWTRTLGGPSADTPWSLAPLADGGVVVAASTQSYGAGSADAWLLNVDDNGAVRWQRTYGGELWDWPGQVAVRPDGGLLMAGYTTSLGAGYEDVWVLRLDAQGRL
ncbi:hypothetical protein CKO28_26600 [Rhodovibrio sodomensis]|uniref:Bulb-type lectin domain-containing protein n=1 Tax=Rhodovibrio sodomensis TaxID=1088 RepID=A0ABS1DNK2_9PROT|nr:hypothetical protein [Rhodovibrio sodomensis]MBK1671571.1 hypothetical protein [Rhodovibrio sodomensis]